MPYKPLVIFFMTSYCNFCKRFYKYVLRPYILRNEIDCIMVNVEPKTAIRAIRDEHLSMSEQETCLHQEYSWVGDRLKDGPSVPGIKIIPPHARDAVNIDIGEFLFSEGDEQEYFEAVRKKLDKVILRRGMVM